MGKGKRHIVGKRPFIESWSHSVANVIETMFFIAK